VRRARPLLLTGIFSACLDPYALDDAADRATDQTTAASSGGGSTSEAGTVGAGTTADASSSSGGEGASEESGPEAADSVGELPSPPVWGWLTTEPHLRVLERGPLEISAYAVGAETMEVRLDGVSLGVVATDDDVVVRHEVPIVFDGQDGEHTIEGIARSPYGEARQQIVVTVDLPPGGQDVEIPWLGPQQAIFDASFALARNGEEVVVLGARDLSDGWDPLLRRLDADPSNLEGWRLRDWTQDWKLMDARAADFGMGMASGADGVYFLAMNLIEVAQSQEPRGYLVGLKLNREDGLLVPVVPEVLLEEGELIEEIAVNDELLVGVGRETVAGGRTVAVVWGFDAVTGEPAWPPVTVDVPNPAASDKPRSARFDGVTFTNDGNLLVVGSTQVPAPAAESATRALLTRLSPEGLLLGEPEIFGDQRFLLQTAALAVSAFDSEDGYCWTGWTRDDDLDPERMVTECRGETQVSRFASDWTNSAGLTIAYTPLTGRIIVGGYRNGLHDAVVISFEGTHIQSETVLGWTYEYASPAGGLDQVTALACQTYECDVLINSDLIGKPQVRVSRVNQ
jgi:hypothetical protein